MVLPVLSWAGNPDRQGEAGAYELLLTPWAKAAGFNLINTSCIGGVEAMRLNPAGIAIPNNGRLQFAASHMRLYGNADVGMNAGGMAFKMGKNGTVGVSIAAMDFGDIKNTTVLLPEGTGGTFSPNFINIGVGYSHSFEDKIFVGVLFRAVSESVTNVSANGVALDAGVQYRGGKDDRVRLGISLRNVGPSMKFTGEGLSSQVDPTAPQTNNYLLTNYYRSGKFEMPTMLNLGVSYDFIMGARNNYLRVLGNFTSNAFSRDNIAVGAEYSYRGIFQVRAAYKYNLGTVPAERTDLDGGLSAGFSASIKTSKQSNNRIAVDYAYRTTRHFTGTHNVGIRYTIGAKKDK